MSTETDTTPKNITHFNKEAFKNCNITLSDLNLNSNNQSAKITKEIKFLSYYDFAIKSASIIEAIQLITLADTGNQKDNRISVIYDLAEILKQINPFNEMEFLDSLFLDPTTKASNLINIEKL